MIKIDKDGIKDAANDTGIQSGDLMYFAKDSESVPHHATIITKVENGDIFYAGNTRSVFDRSLTEAIGDETVFIIKIFDDAE